MTKNLLLIEAAARELPRVSLGDALRILTVMAEKRDPRFDRAATRWVERVMQERPPAPEEQQKMLRLVDGMHANPEAASVGLREYAGE